MGNGILRPDNWPDLLANYVATDVRFQWGENDCGLWVCGWLFILTGIDHAESFRGIYDTEEGATQALNDQGYPSLEDLADERLVPIPLSFAKRGDIVLSPTGSLGICNGVKSHFLGADGVIAIHTHLCVKAWSAD